MYLGNNSYSKKIIDINVQFKRQMAPLSLQMQQLQTEKARTSKALSSTSAWELVDDKGLVGIAEERKKLHKNIKFYIYENLDFCTA